GRAALDRRRRRGDAPAACRRPRPGRSRELDRTGTNPEAGRLVRRGQPHPRAAADHGTGGPGGHRTAAGLGEGPRLAAGPAASAAAPARPRDRATDGSHDNEGTGDMVGTAGGARQGILSLAVKDKAQLYAAYMPYLKYGGIFVPTTKRYFLGDEVFLLLTLPESSERLPVAGKVVWVTPAGAQGNRPAGIGVQFGDGAEGESVKGKIEALLAGLLNSERPTHTM